MSIRESLRRKALLLPLISLFIFLLLILYHQYSRPPGTTEKEVILDIPPGRTLREIAERLKEEGLIRSPLLFRLTATYQGKGRRLQSGEYLLSPTMRPEEILDILYRGRVYLHRVTIPEGYNIRETADLLERKGLLKGDEFLALAADPGFASSLGLEAASLEGYLFPDTYLLSRRMDGAAIARKMVENFKRRFTPKHQERAKEVGLTVHEIVTLASIIEKEVKVPEERPLVSAVFHNRLKNGIPLQADPTVLYALPPGTDNIRKDDLSVDSPYNTYLHKGLPPGPIASPGTDSIIAALYPAEEDYLYFVSRNDGSHHFSRTLSEHNRAVKLYQRGNLSPQ